MCALLKILSCWCVSDKRKSKSGKDAPVIFVFGTRVSGKATVGERLAESIGYNYLNTSTMAVSFNGKLVEDLSKAKSTISPDVITRVLIDRIASANTTKGFVIADFPRNLAEAKRFDQEFRKPDIVIFCYIPEDVYLSRFHTKYGAIKETVGKQNYANECKDCEEVYKHYKNRAIKLATTTPISENNDRLFAATKKWDSK